MGALINADGQRSCVRSSASYAPANAVARRAPLAGPAHLGKEARRIHLPRGHGSCRPWLQLGCQMRRLQRMSGRAWPRSGTVWLS